MEASISTLNNQQSSQDNTEMKSKSENKNDPYAGINFVKRKAILRDAKGEIIFEKEVEFPDFYSDTSVSIVTSKYLQNSAKKTEHSVREMFDRVSDTITRWGVEQGYFTEEESKVFNYKLKYYQIHQYFAFNSPVYFNVGIRQKPQCSACFILEIDDDMHSIFETIKLESLIYKWGSGTGINMSTLRSSYERVRGGGFASGPVSFMKAADTAAGVIKSGGTLRRSAKLVRLDVTHPDIIRFIHCKEKEEEKLRLLREHGIEPEQGYELTDEVFFQNTNITVGLTDEFMHAVLNDAEWWTYEVTTGQRLHKYKARDILREIAETSWRMADPGVQYHDTINKWNTCANSGEIKTSNPCGEYVFLPNSSCNLASINLLKFVKKNGDKYEFDFNTFEEVVNIVFAAQDIIIDMAYYPNEAIERNSIDFRPIGLGYTNLGATLMYLGLPYDSDEGRLFAACVTAILTGVAYATSHMLSKVKGPFNRFEENREPFYYVLSQHIKHVKDLIVMNYEKEHHPINNDLLKMAELTWTYIAQLIQSGATFRNAQATLLAPTGTISFIMDCATTGIEPEYSLVRYKRLANNGDGMIKIVNPVVEQALYNLGYQEEQVKSYIETLKKDGHLENTDLPEEHLKIFDTAVPGGDGKRFIDYKGHIKMLAAVQPFLSGAISKTVNLPSNITVDEIYDLYIEAWKLGLKGLTIYRDGSKAQQILYTKKDKKEEKKDNVIELDTHRKKDQEETAKEEPKAEPTVIVKQIRERRPLPDERNAIVHKFRIGQCKGYITCGLYDDGSLGEIFINIAKEGSTLSGLLDSLATIVSISLQYGVPLKEMVSKMMFQRFEPAGFTNNPKVRIASSLVDYIFRYLGVKFLPIEDQIELGLVKTEQTEQNNETTLNGTSSSFSSSAPMCKNCGHTMIRKGTCYLCVNCGDNEGACG